MFADPPRSLYILLIVAVIISGAILARKQDRRSLGVFAIFLLLLLSLFVTDRLIESHREEVVRRVQAMAAAASAANGSEFIENVSKAFKAPNGRTRDDLLNSQAWGLLREHKVAVTVWDFTREDFKQNSDGEVEIGFMAKGEPATGGIMRRYCKGTFVRDADGGWRLKGFEFFNPVTKQPEPIPGYP